MASGFCNATRERALVIDVIELVVKYDLHWAANQPREGLGFQLTRARGHTDSGTKFDDLSEAEDLVGTPEGTGDSG